MEICNAVVIVHYIFPYHHCMFMVTVKRPVNKFYLFYFIIDKNFRSLLTLSSDKILLLFQPKKDSIGNYKDILSESS